MHKVVIGIIILILFDIFSEFLMKREQDERKGKQIQVLNSSERRITAASMTTRIETY
jgi:uncharacterized protein YxeA